MKKIILVFILLIPFVSSFGVLVPDATLSEQQVEEYINNSNFNFGNNNVTAGYFFGDGSFLTGILGGFPRWLNTSNSLYINSSYPQNINISGNATFGG